MNHNDLSAEEMAGAGFVSRLIEKIRQESDVGSQYRMLAMLPSTVQAAADNGRITDALDILGADGINLHQQMMAIKILAASGKEEWLAGVLGSRELPEAIELRIMKALANAGEISAVLRIADGRTAVSEETRMKSGDHLATAFLAATDEKRKKLTKDELLSITSMLAKKANPLAGDGVLSRGNGGMVPQMRKLASRSLKR